MLPDDNIEFRRRTQQVARPKKVRRSSSVNPTAAKAVRLRSKFRLRLVVPDRVLLLPLVLCFALSVICIQCPFHCQKLAHATHPI